MSKLQALLEKTPQWMHVFNRKYQIETVIRMNELLQQKGMTEKELAEKAQWTEGYVHRMLSGRQNLTLKTLAQFEAAVGADVLEVTDSSEKATGSQDRPSQ